MLRVIPTVRCCTKSSGWGKNFKNIPLLYPPQWEDIGMQSYHTEYYREFNKRSLFNIPRKRGQGVD